MSIFKALVGLVFLLYLGFVAFEFLGYSNISYTLESFIVPVIALIYILFIKKINIFFLCFILCCALSDLVMLAINQYAFDDEVFLYDFVFYIGNVFYILAYIFLLVKICKSLNFKYIFKYFKLHLLVLTALNIFLIYVIQDLVIATLVFDFEYYFELFYNLITFVLLSLSLLNYFYKDNRKSLYLFLGSLCIVFSEMMDIAYFYISEKKILSLVSTTLTIIAFYYFYEQAKLLNKLREEKRFIDYKT